LNLSSIDSFPEFYLVHKIAMDISFHIEFGIFIPHTSEIANQAP